MKTTAAGTPHRLMSLLALANLAALVCVAYLARRVAISETAWNARQNRSASLATSASILKAGRIETATSKPVHLLADSAVTGVASFLPEILRRAGISAERLSSVIPDAPRPISNTPLMRTNERITLADVSLEQIVRIAHALIGNDGGRRLDALAVRSARNGQAEQWDAELLITTVVHPEPSPGTAPGSASRGAK